MTQIKQPPANPGRFRWRKVADQLRLKLPKLVSLLDDARERYAKLLPTFLVTDRAKLHPANPLERLSGEIRRRTEVVSISPNEDAIVRLVGALLLEKTDEWAVQRSQFALLEPGVCRNLKR